MAATRKGTAVTKEWFDRMEEVLLHEAALAGLFQHGGTIGTAREYFVSRVLKAFIPPIVHVGSGQVTDMRGGISRQIDVVIYDPRFPYLEVSPGLGLYFVEGVIATIEVKSTLDKGELEKALENCLSVISLSVRLRDDDALKKGIEEVNSFMDKKDPKGRVLASFMPRTYIFGYQGYKTPSAMGEVVQTWFQRKGNPGSPAWPWLPRVIVAEGCVGMSRDEGFPYVPDDQESAEIKKDHGDAAEPAMMIAKAKRRFGMLALHLLRAIVDRLGTTHDLIGVKYDLYGYIPDDEYFVDWTPEDVKPYWVVRGSTRPLPPEKPDPANPGDEAS